MEKKRDIGISFARLISMCMIIVCHIMQRDKIGIQIFGQKVLYSDWLDVGVQCFLFISGCLYGRKEKLEPLRFYKKAFPKILVDYYLYIVPLLLIILTTNVWNWEITQADIFNLLTFSGHTQGFGHLWFIKNILFCYLLTPVLLEIVNSFSDQFFEVKILLSGVLFHIAVAYQFPGFKPACFNCYWLGIAWTQAQKRKRRGWNAAIFFGTVLLLIGEGLMTLWGLNRTQRVIFTFVDNYCHDLLGASIVLLICWACRNLQKSKNHILQCVLTWSDRYSYDVYLTHFVFFWSPLDVLRRIDNKALAILTALGLTVVATYIIHFLADMIRGKLFKGNQYSIDA